VNASLPLAQLLGHTADVVQAVRAGQSLNEALARCPAAARAGTQALSFQVLRQLGCATALRRRLAPKAPPPALDALLLSALALLLPVSAFGIYMLLRLQPFQGLSLSNLQETGNWLTALLVTLLLVILTVVVMRRLGGRRLSARWLPRRSQRRRAGGQREVLIA
jgi:hypothetical protein